MTREDQLTVIKYLKDLNIKSMEFFEEMYDHILTSFESQQSDSQNIDTHIRDIIQPGFGGVDGIKKVMKSQQRLRQKAIFSRAKKLFLSYLTSWPTVLITLLIGLIIHQLNTIINPKDVLLIVLTVSALIPPIIAVGGQIKFYLSCKKQNKPYSSSDLNQRLVLISAIGCNFLNLLLNLVAKFIWGNQNTGFENLASYPILQIALCLLFILYGLVVLQLIKEKFILKLSTQ